MNQPESNLTGGFNMPESDITNFHKKVMGNAPYPLKKAVLVSTPTQQPTHSPLLPKSHTKLVSSVSKSIPGDLPDP
jgi:hypothetical protein